MSRIRAIYTLSCQVRTIVTFLMGFYLGSGNVEYAILSLIIYSILDFLDSILYWRAIDEIPRDK